ncbi:unnamed protein product [Pleuronectes platessa]|uniref:Uncharacterized protein n=1 Tax=Pleuronectes platessa TaxID=8262 RepID=A0A9N7V1V5_PLEPL|nr:unnamed protein product [Pleuronectes platessa]
MFPFYNLLRDTDEILPRSSATRRHRGSILTTPSFDLLYVSMILNGVFSCRHYRRETVVFFIRPLLNCACPRSPALITFTRRRLMVAEPAAAWQAVKNRDDSEPANTVYSELCLPKFPPSAPSPGDNSKPPRWQLGGAALSGFSARPVSPAASSHCVTATCQTSCESQSPAASPGRASHRFTGSLSPQRPHCFISHHFICIIRRELIFTHSQRRQVGRTGTNMSAIPSSLSSPSWGPS